MSPNKNGKFHPLYSENAQDLQDIQEQKRNRASVDKYRHNEFHLRQTDLLSGLLVEKVPYHGSNR